MTLSFYFYGMRKTKLLLLILILSVLTAELIFINRIFSLLQSFLTKSEKTEANILIVEGWLSYDGLILATNEFNQYHYDYILTTGLQAMPEYYAMNRSGYLIFYVPDSITQISKIALVARSGNDGGRNAGFNVYAGSELIGSFNAIPREKYFTINRNSSGIDSIIIEVPDTLSSSLLVKEIILNDDIHLPYFNNSEYDIGANDNKMRIVNDFTSVPELAAKRIIVNGINSALVKPVTAQKVRVNRTFTSAVAVDDWLKENDITIKGFNVISYGSHSRRTWMTFNHILKPYKVGVIAIPDSHVTPNGKIRYFKTARETFAFLYYCIILSMNR